MRRPRSRNYDIRFGELPATAIADHVIVANPVYGQPIGEYGSRPVEPDPGWYRKLEGENGFYTRLEESVLREGFRNPIFCHSIEQGTFCRYGATRLWVAKRRGLKIPCVIADYVGRWSRLLQLNSAAAVKARYRDKPAILEIDAKTMRIEACPHSHLSP